MAAANRPHEMGQAFKRGVDPGAAGTLRVLGHDTIFPIKTAAAEARTLPAPTGIEIGTKVAVLLETDGGDLTLTVTGGMNQAANTSAVFNTAGDMLLLMVISVTGTKRYEVIENIGSVVLS